MMRNNRRGAHRTLVGLAMAGLIALLLLMGGDLAHAKKPPKPPPPDPDPFTPALAFVRGGNLTVMDSSGDTVETWYRSRDVGDVAWSPDGTQLAFIRAGGIEPTDLWLMDADGSNARLAVSGLPMSLNDERDTIAWFPDGEKMLIVPVGMAYATFDLFSVELSTGTVTALGLSDLFDTLIHSGSVGPDLETNVDGWQGWLVFCTYPVPNAPYRNMYAVYVREVTGTGGSDFQIDDTTLIRYELELDQNGARLNPQGDSITFYDDGVRKVATFDDVTGELGVPAPLVESSSFGGFTYDGDWSADGSWFVGCTSRKDPDIVIVRADGTGLTWLTQNKKTEMHPAWNPNWVNDLD